MKSYLHHIIVALRVLIVLSVLLGVAYPLLTTAVGQVPGLKSRADGSLVERNGKLVGSRLIGQAFADVKGNPLRQYFQPRPSAGGYDPTASGASNLGPESVEDAADAPSLLTQVCARSLEIGQLNGVDGARPYCTADGVGAALRVFPADGKRITRAVSVNQPCPATPFIATYHGTRVVCARKGADYQGGRLVVVRGRAPAHPAVPADAVTASGSGLDPDISPAYARVQAARVAQARGVAIADIRALVKRTTDGRTLGFLGEPTVNVLELNLALDRAFPGH